MTRKTLLAVAVALILALPTLLVVGPTAVAQATNPVPTATVPTAPTVPWQPLVGFSHTLYLKYRDARADAVSDESAPQPSCSDNGGSLGFSSADPGSAFVTDTRGECAYPISTPTTSAAAVTLTFTSANILLPFTIAGNDSLFYHHEGSIPDDATLTVSVINDGRTLATGTRTFGENDAREVFLRLSNDETRKTVNAQKPLILTLAVSAPLTSAPQAGQLPVSGGVPTWTVRDTGSYLRVTSIDAMKAATWLGDDNGLVTTLFRPLPRDAPENSPRIHGFFAVQSAFGANDAKNQAPGESRRDPTFRVLRDNQVVGVGPGGAATIPAFYNLTVALERDGVAAWSFPAGYLDYRGLEAGEYALQVTQRHYQGATLPYGTQAKFFLTAQAVRLTTFAESDAAVTLPPETQAHEVLPGGTTTYLFLVNNTGSVNDTFRLDATPVSTGASAWSAVFGGPSVLDRRVSLAPGESKVVTLTVLAPFLQQGASSIYEITATSTIDPTVKSAGLTAVTTIGSTVQREVGIILAERNLSLEPGVDKEFSVYAWNRGTRTANVSLEIEENPVPDWSIDLLQGGLTVDRLVLSNVRPGDIAEAVLRVRGPVDTTEVNHLITLNATNVDVSSVSFERDLLFQLVSQAAVKVEVLNKIGTTGHFVESEWVDRVGTLECAADFCPADGMDGAWFRVWVTNTGKVKDNFILSIDSVSFANVRNDCSDSALNPHEPGSNDFRFFTRTPGGQRSVIDRIDNLLPGKTAEVYVWHKADRAAPLCEDQNTGTDFLDFVVSARGEQTRAVGIANPRLVIENNEEPVNAVLLEGVQRKPIDENNPSKLPYLVDISQADRATVTGLVEVGQNTTYFVRVTNAASWSTHTDEDGNAVAPRVTVSVEGLDRSKGWNASIRLVKDQADAYNPFTDKVSFTNELGGVDEGWFDQELQVNVTAPNATLGKEPMQFFLQARLPDGASSTLAILTRVAELAKVDVATDTQLVRAHAGDPSGSLITIYNNGSVETSVTVRAQMDPTTTQGAQSWRVEPPSSTFKLPAFKNRTIALSVTPPANANAGVTGDLNVTVEYTKNLELSTETENETLRLLAEVAPRGTLELAGDATDVVISPGASATFPLTLRNGASGGGSARFLVSATDVPNWNATLSPLEGTLAGGDSRSIVYVLKAPIDVVNGSRFASIIRVVDPDNADNFDSIPVTVNILGGKPVPSISAPVLQKRVDRGGEQAFEVAVKNLGSAAGKILLENFSSDAGWTVTFRDNRNVNVTSVDLAPNQLMLLNVTVRAPLHVPERTIVPIDVIASTDDRSQSSRVPLRAEIHDYGVGVSLVTTRLEATPGLPVEFVIKVRNTGNDNDTINVSAILPPDEMLGWSVQFNSDRARLEAGQEAELRALVRLPQTPLPPARTYSFKFYAATVDGAKVNLTRNETVTASVQVLNYRSIDVDRDERLEVAVDLDRKSSNGFEVFREIFSDGPQTNVIATTTLDGKTRFFLDVPRDRPLDGIADVWFDPESVYAYSITHAPDLNKDGTPDYLLDTNRDAKIDRAYDTVTDRYWTTLEIKAYGDERPQYLVDSNADGRPDHFYDPETKKVTKTTATTSVGRDYVGLDTDDDGKVDHYYNVKTASVEQATVANFSDFAKTNWYFFAAFAALVLLTVILLVVRRRRS